MKIFAAENVALFLLVFYFIPSSVVFSFSAFNHHLLARAGYVPFGTPIVSFIWR